MRKIATKIAIMHLERRGVVGVCSRRPADALHTNYLDLWRLYRLIQKREPKIILEFGAGSSTLAMAMALREKKCKGSHIFSIESEQRWADALNKQIVDEGLETYITVYQSPLKQRSYDGIQVWEYLNVPALKADFVYLDGPALTDSVRVTINPILMENDFDKNCIMVVDGRHDTCAFLKRHLKRDHVVKKDRIRGNTEFYWR